MKDLTPISVAALIPLHPPMFIPISAGGLHSKVAVRAETKTQPGLAKACAASKTTVITAISSESGSTVAAEGV